MTKPHTTLSEAVRATLRPEPYVACELASCELVYTEDQVDAILAAAASKVEQHEAQEPIELVGVQEQMKEGAGFWHSCSGCHETEDGHPVGSYPYSDVFKCALGNGCSECGGIGAVWDNTDYDAMAVGLESDSAQPTLAATQAVDTLLNASLDALHLIERIIEGKEWGAIEEYADDLRNAIDAAMSPTTTRSE